MYRCFLSFPKESASRLSFVKSLRDIVDFVVREEDGEISGLSLDVVVDLRVTAGLRLFPSSSSKGTKAQDEISFIDKKRGERF